MRYVVEKLPATVGECPFSQPAFSKTDFICNHNYPNQCLCSLFTDRIFPPKHGECNGLIELATALNKGENHA